MKNLLKYLPVFAAALFFTTSCQEETENPNQFSDADIVSAENEANIESAFEDVDDIVYDGMFYIASDGRTEVSDDSPISCAVRTHDKENKIITIDFGDGCEGKDGRIRSGKIIIHYTDRLWVPGAQVTVTFEDFYCDGKKIEGTRIRTNISESMSDYLRFRIELIGGKVTWEDGTYATRDAVWEVTRIRTPNPMNDERIRTGHAEGVTKEGIGYKVTITEPIVWKRGCLPKKKVMIPVKGVKVTEFDNGVTITIDYGDGECDNLVTITKDGVTKTVEIKRWRR